METVQLLFDLDGTLSDPLEGIWRSINYGLESYGYPTISREEAVPFIGPPLDQSYRALTGRTDKEFIEDIVGKYRERFGLSGYAENTLYPNIPEVLAQLDTQGTSMAICTSKRADFARRILEMFKLERHFQFVSGGDVGMTKIIQIRQLLDEGRVDRSTIMIGDRSFDLVAAHENGLRSAGVLWGYGTREELETESPDYLLSEPIDLQNLPS